MKEAKKEFSLGIFIIIGLICVGYLTINLGKLNLFENNVYPVYANFSSVAGLREGANIEIAGVRVGNVGTIKLDSATLLAKVELYIQNDIILTDDTIASIKTSGLIGDKYVSLTVGGSSTELQANDTIFDTESPLDIEALVGKYVFGDVE